MAATLRYFRKPSEDEVNTNDWHAYREDSPAALCGDAQLAYNVDSIADAVPDGGTLHKGCDKALTKEAKEAEKAEAAAAKGN